MTSVNLPSQLRKTTYEYHPFHKVQNDPTMMGTSKYIIEIVIKKNIREVPFVFITINLGEGGEMIDVGGLFIYRRHNITDKIIYQRREAYAYTWNFPTYTFSV